MAFIFSCFNSKYSNRLFSLLENKKSRNTGDRQFYLLDRTLEKLLFKVLALPVPPQTWIKYPKIFPPKLQNQPKYVSTTFFYLCVFFYVPAVLRPQRIAQFLKRNKKSVSLAIIWKTVSKNFASRDSFSKEDEIRLFWSKI